MMFQELLLKFFDVDPRGIFAQADLERGVCKAFEEVGTPSACAAQNSNVVALSRYSLRCMAANVRNSHDSASLGTALCQDRECLRLQTTCARLARLSSRPNLFVCFRPPVVTNHDVLGSARHAPCDALHQPGVVLASPAIAERPPRQKKENF